jgi:hypothetical protein
MIENFKSKIRQFLPMSFLSKSWGPSFDLVGHCLSPVSLGDFLNSAVSCGDLLIANFTLLGVRLDAFFLPEPP